MTYNQIRSALYWTARRMGDVRSVERAITTGTPKPVLLRIVRVILGRLFGRVINRI